MYTYTMKLFISWRTSLQFINLYFLKTGIFENFNRRRAAAKRKKLKLVSGPGGGDGVAPEEEEDDPEEDSSLAGTGHSGGFGRREDCFNSGGKSSRPSRRGAGGGYQAIARIEKRIRFDWQQIFFLVPILVLLRYVIRGVVKQQSFYWAVILLVFFNTCCVAVEHYDQPDWLSEFLEIAEYAQNPQKCKIIPEMQK